MYFKDGVYAQQQSMPRMVSSVRPPLMPDGYYGEDAGGAADSTATLKEIVTNPWYLGIAAVVIILIIWFMMKK